MHRRARICVNVAAAILIIAFMIIFTGLFLGGGRVLVEQDIAGQLKNAFHQVMAPPADRKCHNLSINSSASNNATSGNRNLTVQPRGRPGEESEPWGVYLCQDSYFREDDSEGMPCTWVELSGTPEGACLSYTNETYHGLGGSGQGSNCWRSLAPDPGVQCLLFSLPDCTHKGLVHPIEHPGVVDVDKWSEMVNCGNRVVYRSFSCAVNASYAFTYQVNSRVSCTPDGI